MHKNTLFIVLGIIGLLIIATFIFASWGTKVEIVPTATSTPEATTNTDENPQTINIDVALIALEDNGASGKKIGCDDSVVLVEQQIPYTTGTLRAAIERLLSFGSDPFGENELYNSLASSDLSVDDVVIANGVATIELTGALSIGGVCDAPRVQAQLEETALQFDTVNSVKILLNGEPLSEALSSQ
jgi:hypothetical protein